MTVVFGLVAALTVADPDVRLSGALGERFDTVVRGNFMQLNLTNDFYKPFLERKATGGFIGLGKNADAAVHFAKHCADPAVRARKDEMIDFIIANQLPDGYTGCLSEPNRLAKLWDIHEMGFIVQGLMSEWELFGNRRALEAARRNVDYVISRWKDMPSNWEFRVTDRETTLGFGFGVARLYAATREEKYRDFLRYERSLDDWNAPIVIGRDRMIFGQAYGYTGTCLEQLELYGYDPRPRYLETSLRALDFQTRGDGVLINGNGGICECWTNDQDGEGAVGETCNAAFELLFWDRLFRLGVADRALLGDLMERCVYNALFAAVSQDGRRTRYYTPLNGERQFWPDDLYCCPNNFRRAMSRLPEYVFYTQAHYLTANLYTACEATADVGVARVQIREETDYPRSGHVRFVLTPDRPAFFLFRLRIPHWAKNARVRVNGAVAPYPCSAGSMYDLPRVWRPGDVVELDLPMTVRTVRGRKRQSGRFAVMRGPIVYALDTRSVPAFKDKSAHEAQTILMMDPLRLTERSDGTIGAVISTVWSAVGIANLGVDRANNANNVCEVFLKPFADEDANLTYFRAPNIERDCQDEDDLFVPKPAR